ncbi:MAG: hypothetical protein HY321_13540 [Armatimonadetes bacterium]|nr:hypothetical protein [Armatimonadota bacterium]
MSPRRLWFLLRWLVFYNAELVWLCWRLPRHIPPGAALPPDSDARRRQAHAELAAATARHGGICAACGRCCLEEVDRFTPFDQLVRARSASPAPSADRRLYSVPWMAWNALSHTAQRLPGRSQQAPLPPCPYVGTEGCRLPRVERPMVCVSWFCLHLALVMIPADMDAAEAPLRAIEALHREAVRAARAAITGPPAPP